MSGTQYSLVQNNYKIAGTKRHQLPCRDIATRIVSLTLYVLIVCRTISHGSQLVFWLF